MWDVQDVSVGHPEGSAGHPEGSAGPPEGSAGRPEVCGMSGRLTWKKQNQGLEQK